MPPTTAPVLGTSRHRSRSSTGEGRERGGAEGRRGGVRAGASPLRTAPAREGRGRGNGPAARLGTPTPVPCTGRPGHAAARWRGSRARPADASPRVRAGAPEGDSARRMEVGAGGQAAPGGKPNCGGRGRDPGGRRARRPRTRVPSPVDPARGGRAGREAAPLWPPREGRSAARPRAPNKGRRKKKRARPDLVAPHTPNPAHPRQPGPGLHGGGLLSSSRTLLGDEGQLDLGHSCLGGKGEEEERKRKKKNASTHGAITPAPTRRMLAHSLQRPTPVTPRTPATPRACVCACVPSQRMRSSTLRCARTAALARSSAAAARPGTAALGPTRQTTPHLAGVARPSLAAAAPAVRAMAAASPVPPGLKPYLCVLKCDRRKGGRPCLTLTHPTHPSPLPFFFLSPPQTKNKTGPPPTRPPWTPT